MTKRSNLLLLISLVLTLALTQNCVGSLSDDLIQTGTCPFNLRIPRHHQPQTYCHWQINVSPNSALLPSPSRRFTGHLLYQSLLIQLLSTSNTTPPKESTSPSEAA